MPVSCAVCSFKKIWRKSRKDRSHCKSWRINRYVQKIMSVSVKTRLAAGACCTSLLRGIRRRKRDPFLPASLTAEAALVLPLMLMALWLLIFPLKVMESERRLQNRMETTAKALAVTAYIKKESGALLKVDSAYADMLEEYGSAAVAAFGTAAISALPETRLLKDLYFSPDTSILSENESGDPAMIRAELIYTLRLPSAVFRILPVQKSLVTNRRAWVGSEGGRGREKYGGLSDSGSEKDRIVYVGKSGTRYHLDPGCHYLSNRMETADASLIGTLRNAGGAAYHACPSCKPGDTGTVYYFASGTAYHKASDCKAITAYARAVPLHEVIHLGPCSYCSKNKGKT